MLRAAVLRQAARPLRLPHGGGGAAAVLMQQRRCFAYTPASAAFPRRTAAELYAEIRELTKPGGDYTVHNYVAVVEDMRPESVLVETELFPAGSIHFYTAKNMGWDTTQEEHNKWYDVARGGGQGDYREGMQAKIDNVVACLLEHSHSKRAIIPIPFNSEGSANVDWTDAAQTKCCRELHLYIEDGKLCCTGFLRVQNATIFPKNIHFFATLLDDVAKRVGVPLGEYTHFISSVCHDRSATQC